MQRTADVRGKELKHRNPNLRTLKFKRLYNDVRPPEKGHKSDACFDLFAYSKQRNPGYIRIGTGISLEIPEGFVGLLFPRSSITKRSMILKNSVGVIDSGFRGEIEFRFLNTGSGSGLCRNTNEYEEGEKIGQLMVIPVPDFKLEEVYELSDSERGTGGFGSTGQ